VADVIIHKRSSLWILSVCFWFFALPFATASVARMRRRGSKKLPNGLPPFPYLAKTRSGSTGGCLRDGLPPFLYLAKTRSDSADGW